MLSEKDIAELIRVRDIIYKETIIYKHLCDTEVLPYIRCLEALGLIRRDRDTAHIYWEKVK